MEDYTCMPFPPDLFMIRIMWQKLLLPWCNCLIAAPQQGHFLNPSEKNALNGSWDRLMILIFLVKIMLHKIITYFLRACLYGVPQKCNFAFSLKRSVGNTVFDQFLCRLFLTLQMYSIALFGLPKTVSFVKETPPESNIWPWEISGKTHFQCFSPLSV